MSVTEEQLKELKEQLTDQLQSLERRIEHREEFDTTELSNYDNHPGDAGTDLFDMERGQAITQFKQEEIDDTKAALEAIENGTYGTCNVCGKEIPYERLEALPTALTCIDHADQEPDLTSRPPEEDVLTGFTSNPVRQEDERLEDFTDNFQDVEAYGSSDSPQDQPGNDEEMGDFFEDKTKD